MQLYDMPSGHDEVTTTRRVQPCNGKFRGISFFVPLCDASPDTIILPEGMHLVNDHTFTIRYKHEKEMTVVGEHYSLYVTQEVLASVFEQRYAEIVEKFPSSSIPSVP